VLAFNPREEMEENNPQLFNTILSLETFSGVYFFLAMLEVLCHSSALVRLFALVANSWMRLNK